VPLGPEFQVETYTTASREGRPSSSDSSGRLHRHLGERGGGRIGLGIFAQRFANNGAPFGSEFLVNTYTTGRKAVPPSPPMAWTAS
jgi:hypothetical protein